MNVKEIMSTDVEIVAPIETVLEAAKKMKRLDVGVLPVCDGRRLVGVITDRDITIRATATERDPGTTQVTDCMTPELIYCFEDQSAVEAERIMADKQIRRLPVLTRDKQLSGIVSLGDIAAKTRNVQETAQTLREISEPGHAK